MIVTHSRKTQVHAAGETEKERHNILVNTEDACSKVPAIRTPTSPRIFTVTSMFDLQK
jgi:hypothetical protein